MHSRMLIALTFIFLASMMLISCSSTGPLDPGMDPLNENTARSMQDDTRSHSLWGLYQFIIDRKNQTVEFVPIRDAGMHLNALTFLEPANPALLSLESVDFNGNIVTAGVGLRHPFLGLHEFTGFDVSGILITDGSLFGFLDDEIRLAKPDQTRLLNADGYSRWWNPNEFQYDGTMFSYKDGVLGLPHEVAEYASTINGYKYFADSLSPSDPVTSATLADRGKFSAGQKNVRNYEIQLDEFGLIFNYAIDACWQFPDGSPPYNVPDDFPPGANRPEAWHIFVTETTNTLFNDGVISGGNLSLSIDVYDWYNPELNVLRVESPDAFAGVSINTPVGGGPGYSTYEVDLIGVTPPEGSLDILITAESEMIGYQGLLPGRKISSYQRHFADVSPVGESLEITSPNGGEEWDAFTTYDITWNSAGPVGNVKLQYSKDDFVSDFKSIVADTANDGLYQWHVPNDPSTTVKVRVSEVGDPNTYDDSDANFSIIMSTIPIWPYMGGNEKSTCLSEFNGTTSTNIKWTYQDEPIWAECPVIGPDGTLYSGIYKNNGTKNSPGCVAIDPTDGSQLWIHFPGNGNYIGRTPAVSPDGNYVYYGSDTGPSGGYRGMIYCLNASDGTEVWSYTVNTTYNYALIDGGPKIGADGSIYFQTLRPMGAARAYGITSSGAHKWDYPINGYSYSNMQYHTPCIGTDGNIYLTDSGGQLWKFDPNGNSLWAGVYVNYHTTYGGSLDADDNFYVVCDDGRDVNKFSSSGTNLWTTPQWDFYLHSSPAHDADGNIYATGGLGYYLRKLDPTDGSYAWTVDLGAITTAMMAVSADGIIYVGCGNGTNGAALKAFNTDGDPVFDIPFTNACRSPVIGSDGTVYVVSGKLLYAIGN